MTAGLNTETFESLRQAFLNDSEVRDLISMRAYEIYLVRGGEAGHEIEDWLRAESEILTLLIEEEVKHTSKPLETTSPLPEPEAHSKKKPRKVTTTVSKATATSKAPKHPKPVKSTKAHKSPKEPRTPVARATVRAASETAVKAKSTPARKKKQADQPVDEVVPVKKRARSA